MNRSRGVGASMGNMLRWVWVCMGTCTLLVFLSIGPSWGWVRDFQPFPEGRATVLLHAFCAAQQCHGDQAAWQNMIRSVIDEWHSAGSRFRFQLRSTPIDTDPCQQQEVVTVILADSTSLCPGDGTIDSRRHSAGRAARWNGGSRVYVLMTDDAAPPWTRYRRVLLHEFGHVLGLGHPDDQGIFEYAIMNREPRYYDPEEGGWVTIDSIQQDDIAGLRALYGESFANRPIALESPLHGQTVTGIGIIRGWACEGEDIALHIPNSGKTIQFVSGMPRGDTEVVCGREDTGFALLINWNNFGRGRQWIELFVDGKFIEARQVEIVYPKQKYLTGVQGEWVLEDWPEPGIDITIAWDEATQNIGIVAID